MSSSECTKSTARRCRKRPLYRKTLATYLKKSRSSLISANAIGYTVDLSNLLSTPHRDFLIKNNGQKVRVDDLKGKTVVLYIVPIYESADFSGDIVDMIQAYDEVFPMGDTEFVFVPVDIDYQDQNRGSSHFDYYFSTMPWPAIPFSDTTVCGDRISRALGVTRYSYPIPYFVIIDPTRRVVATRQAYPHLFKFFGGAELHPFSLRGIRGLWREHCFHDFSRRNEVRQRFIGKWDQLLASPTRDFLLSSNGDQVPISSLKGKIIGLYFCDNLSRPPRMELIKKVYAESKLRGYDFEIVQINFHYRFFTAEKIWNTNPGRVDTPVQPCHENISWLTLPFKDPSCRKLHRIFDCQLDNVNHIWNVDSLVIIDPRQAGEALPEFYAAEFLEHYGIEAYPFTLQSAVETECRMQKKELKLQWLFPPGFCQLIRPGEGDRFDLANGAQLKGKRVVVLFAKQSECESSTFVAMLKSKYREQAEEEENKFEVVYVPTDYVEYKFSECIKGTPWLVHPYVQYSRSWPLLNIYRPFEGVGVAAFDRDGELIAKQCIIKWREIGHHKLKFPFISHDLKGEMEMEVNMIVDMLLNPNLFDDEFIEHVYNIARI